MFDTIFGVMWLINLKKISMFTSYFYTEYVFSKLTNNKIILNIIWKIIFIQSIIFYVYGSVEMILNSFNNGLLKNKNDLLDNIFYIILISVFLLVINNYKEVISKKMEPKIIKGEWGVKNLFYEGVNIYMKFNYKIVFIFLVLLSGVFLLKFYTFEYYFWNIIIEKLDNILYYFEFFN